MENFSDNNTPDEVHVERMIDDESLASERSSPTASPSSSFSDDSSDPTPIPIPELDVEPSILDADPKESSLGPEIVTFEIVEEASKQQRAKLVDSRGYSYNVKEKTKKTTYWQCTVRNKNMYCKSTLKQVGSTFTPGKQEHNHPAEVGAATVAKIVADVKRKATTNIFKPASAIVEEVLSDRLNDGPCPALPKPAHVRCCQPFLSKNETRIPQIPSFVNSKVNPVHLSVPEFLLENNQLGLISDVIGEKEVERLL